MPTNHNYGIYGKSAKASRFASLALALIASLLTAGQATGGVNALSEPELQMRLDQPESGLKRIVTELEQTITSGDATAMERLIDVSSILAAATAAGTGSKAEEIRKVFSEGTRTAWEKNSPANDYMGTAFRFLRVRTINEASGLLFRAESENGAINFHLFSMSEPSVGRFRIVDMHTVGLNESTTKSLRRTYSHLLSSFLGKDAGKEGSEVGAAYVESLQEIADMNTAMRNGKYAQALEIWSRLPKDVQRERSVLMTRIDAAENISEDARNAAMEEWLAIYRDEMDLPLKVADYYINRHRWADAQRVLGNVIELVGGDSRMQFQMGQVAYRMKQSAGALADAARFLPTPPSTAADSVRKQQN